MSVDEDRDEYHNAQFALLSENQKSCSNYRNVPNFWSWHNQKAKDKRSKNGDRSKFIIEDLMLKRDEWYIENCQHFEIDITNPTHAAEKQRKGWALQSIHVDPSPFRVTICEPQAVQLSARRKKKDSLYLDFHKNGAKSFKNKELFSNVSESNRTTKNLTHLIFVNDYLQTDIARNCGGNLTICEVVCENGLKEDVHQGFRIMETKYERLCRTRLTATFRRIVTDGEPTLFVACLEFIRGDEEGKMDAYCELRWRLFKKLDEDAMKI